MRQVLHQVLLGLFVIAALAALGAAAHAMEGLNATTNYARYEANMPMVVKYVATCALPQGGKGCCADVDAGAALRLTCDAANPCYYRAVSDYTDGGHPDAGGAYAVAGADAFLASRTPEPDGLPNSLNAICGWSVDGGTLQVGVLYP